MQTESAQPTEAQKQTTERAQAIAVQYKPQLKQALVSLAQLYVAIPPKFDNARKMVTGAAGQLLITGVFEPCEEDERELLAALQAVLLTECDAFVEQTLASKNRLEAYMERVLTHPAVAVPKFPEIPSPLPSAKQ